MALFVIERSFAEALGIDAELIDETQRYNDSAGLRWIFSFLSADSRKTYCLYEAPNAEALRAQAADLGLPADAIVEVTEINPTLYAEGGSISGFPHHVSG